MLKERWELSEKKIERFCACVLDHFLIVMRCHMQVINADMFIT